MARKPRYRRGRRRKRGFASWSLGKKIAVILSSTLLAVLAIGTVILASKMSKIETTQLDAEKLNISEEVEHETGYVNVALFGLDSRENDLGKGNRSDTIMIASLNRETKEVKLVSVYRDTLLELDDGSFNKANAAYSFGGPEAAISMLNRNLDLDIEDYVSVNFLAMADVVDALDGVDIELTDEEVVHMNNYCVETSEVTGKSYERIEPEVGGTYHLNGVQAVSYARIRYTAGGDFTRTERQRLLIEKVVEKAKDAGIVKINEIIDAVLPEVSTSLSASEILQMAVGVFDYTLGDSKGFPFDSATPESVPGYSGSYVVPVGLENNVIQLHEFLFPDEEYTPTEKLTSISDNIAYITGIYPEVTSDSTTQESGSESTEDNGYGY